MGRLPVPPELRSRLAQVLWIGGPTDAGKTSVARALAARYGLRTYHYDLLDRLEPPGHWARVDPARHPHMLAALRRSREETWVETTPEAMLAVWRGTAGERFSLTVEDLLALPPGPPVVAEGYGFLPELVVPLIGSPQQAIWLLPTEGFRAASRARRGKGTRWADTSDPERARRNHLGRDVLIGELVREQAKALGCAVLEVDGSLSVDETAAIVAAHSAPLGLLPPGVQP